MTQWALVADIGGTHARFGLADLVGGAIRDRMTLVNAEHDGLEAAIASYLERSGATGRIESAAIAVAGPVHDDRAQLTNGAWGFRTQELKASLGLTALHLLNDFQALALSLPDLAMGDLVRIGGGEGNPAGVRVVMGPGTGFGGAVLVPGQVARVIPGEIGHTSLPTRGPEEAEIAAGLADADGHIPVENALSGPGLTDGFATEIKTH